MMLMYLAGLVVLCSPVTSTHHHFPYQFPPEDSDVTLDDHPMEFDTHRGIQHQPQANDVTNDDWIISDDTNDDHPKDQMSSNDLTAHGGIPMGPTDGCDDGVTGIEIDWSSNSTSEYECEPGVEIKPDMNYKPEEECEEKTKKPIHICISVKIKYKERLPVSGRHRPVWPTYGTYVYLPPQRYLHGLEHSAILLLYHPCADKAKVQLLIDLLRSCVRRHLISPSKNVSTSKPYALLAWGCKLEMAVPDLELAKEFIKDRAHKGREPKVYSDGLYTEGLLQKAKIVSDYTDDVVCPNTETE